MEVKRIRFESMLVAGEKMALGGLFPHTEHVSISKNKKALSENNSLMVFTFHSSLKD